MTHVLSPNYFEINDESFLECATYNTPDLSQVSNELSYSDIIAIEHCNSSVNGNSNHSLTQIS